MGVAVSGDRDRRQDDGRPEAVAVLVRTAQWIVPAYALLLLTTVIDRLDAAVEPHIDLTGTIALVAWVFAESGQTLGIVAIVAVLLVVLATRPGPAPRRRAVEAVVLVAVSLLTLYGGKLFNDGVVKPAVGVARPDIVALADDGVLEMDVDTFYDLSEERRSEHLESIKSETGFGEIEMRPEVRDHWVKETAFARPSGHSLASMTFATLYVSVAFAWLSGWRRRAFQLLVPWAVCVCLSRAVLRVHWPADILIGGLAGVVVGVVGFLMVQALLHRFERTSPTDPRPA